MWSLMKYGQSWTQLSEKYNEIIEEYKKFGLDLIDIKKDLEFYLSIVPVVFLTGAIIHLYFFRKAHTKIAKLQGQKETMAKQIQFLRGIIEKHIQTKVNLPEKKTDEKIQEEINKNSAQESKSEVIKAD